MQVFTLAENCVGLPDRKASNLLRGDSAYAQLQRSAEGPGLGDCAQSGLLATGRNACGGGCACLLAAAPWFRGTFGSLADQFHAHQAGDELFCPDTVKINCRTLDIGFSHDPKPVLIMLDALTF